jgi:hypothetical protein
MKWAEMSAEERDRLVHEKVMGLRVEPCATAQYYGDKQQIVVRCEGCGYEFEESNITSYGEHGPDAYALQPMHNIPVPHYSASMDAAMLIVKRINEPGKPDASGARYRRYGLFVDALEKIVGSNMFFDLFYYYEGDFHLTADRICLASLEACGVEVE